MTQALIAEDEPILAATLTQALQRLWPELEIVAACPNGIDAVEKALQWQPDVLFLDIKMPGKTGLEAAEELTEEWPDGKAFPQIVFVTAYDEFAVQAFEHDAVDYVLKPISDARLAKTIARLRERMAAPPGMDQLLVQMRSLMGVQAPAERLTIIRAAVGNTVRMIPVADVIYFEAADKYVNVATAEGEVLIRTSLKELLPQLDPGVFWQVHRGTIVNSLSVTSATRDEAGKISLSLKGRNDKVRVSPLYAHLFRQM